MNKAKLALGVTAVLAAALAAFGVWQFRLAGAKAEELSASKSRHEQANQKIAVLEERLRTESARANATESDNATLTTAIARAQAAKNSARTAAPVKLTQEAVRARYEHARALVKNGDPAEALQELLWCFDVGMVGNSSYAGVRSSYVLSSIMELGRQNPAAVAALRERRDKAQQRILAGGGDSGEIPDLTALNRVLGETQNTLAVFDQLPVGDRRRQTMSIYAGEALLEAQRYSDVMVGKSYALMISNFEMTTQERPIPATTADPERLRSAMRNSAITSTAKNVEVLAGAGDLDHARTLMGRLLAYDNSESTQAAVRQHLTRAGHPELLPEPTKP